MEAERIDGDVPMCTSNKDKDDELKSKKTEKRMVKAEADNDFVTLTVTYTCARETKMKKTDGNQRRKKRKAATEQKAKEAAKI